jgi:hypothetical protein
VPIRCRPGEVCSGHPGRERMGFTACCYRTLIDGDRRASSTASRSAVASARQSGPAANHLVSQSPPYPVDRSGLVTLVSRSGLDCWGFARRAIRAIAASRSHRITASSGHWWGLWTSTAWPW